MGNPLPAFDPDFAGPAQWAALYRAIGLQIVPGYMPGEGNGSWKRPLLSSWTAHQNELMADDAFARLYGAQGRHVARPNMGLITGRCSRNGFVVDLDAHRNPAALAWWHAVLEVENNGLDLETVEQRTGGGGIQKLFLAPPGLVVPTIKTSIGVDIRGQGGFAVLPPSLHESGRHYDWLPGRAPWEIEIEVAPDWLLEAISDLAEAHGGAPAEFKSAIQTSPVGIHGEQVVNEFGTVIDGREHLMRDVVWHAVLELYRASPIMPPEGEWRLAAAQAYVGYEMKVNSRLSGAEKSEGLEREGRGSSEFFRKWRRMMRLWGSPKMVEAAARPPPVKPVEDPAAEFQQAAEQAQAQATADPARRYEYFDAGQILDMADPVWLIDEVINEQSLGFIFGPPGSVKTFIALDMALSLTTRRGAWWKRSIRQHGAVIYLCREGVKSLKFRLMAWEAHHKVTVRGTPFYLIQQNINFMTGDDVGTLEATVAAIVAEAGVPPIAVFVDTVSRVLPGAEENQQKDMTMFIGACDRLRQGFGCVVIGVHHTNKTGGFRGSTVMPAAGDFMLETRREPGAMDGVLFAFKIKDAEDGWEQPFEILKVPVGTLGAQTSLVVAPIDKSPRREPQTAWPDTHICRQVLAAIDEEWGKGRPWCFARNSSRAAVTNIMKRWQIKRAVVEDMLATWTANGVVVEELCDARNHVTGYRKLLDI